MNAKSLFGPHRQLAKPMLNSVPLPSQFGAGASSGGTDLAHLLLGAQIQVAEKEKLCIAHVFVDVVTAFATVARHFVLPSLPQSKEHLVAKLLQLGFDDNDVGESQRWRDGGRKIKSGSEAFFFVVAGARNYK